MHQADVACCVVARPTGDRPVVVAVTHDVQQAGVMLQDMLAEVVNGSDVAKAFASLLDEDTPTLAELRHGSKLSQIAVPLPDVENADRDQISVAGAQRAAMTHDGNDRSQSETVSSQESVDEYSVQHGQGENESDGIVDLMLQRTDFLAFAEFVLDSACFSLLQESATGNWQSPSAKLSHR